MFSNSRYQAPLLVGLQRLLVFKSQSHTEVIVNERSKPKKEKISKESEEGDGFVTKYLFSFYFIF
jgi:copper oxidase (laccase) domain-containing protein